jgi:integrase
MKTDNTTFDVRIWPTIREYKGARGTTYQVRRAVAGREINRPSFATYALADAFRSQLHDAVRRGEPFDIESGVPLSMQRAAQDSTSVYQAALDYVDHKWKSSAAAYRRDIAKCMTTVVCAMLPGHPSNATARDMRTALREWAFNTERRERAPAAVADVLRWVERNALPVKRLEDSAQLGEVMAALSRKVDGQPVAASTQLRRRATLHNFAEWAVERHLLESNEVAKTKRVRAKAVRAIDKRSLPNEDQAAAMLAAVRRRKPSGERVYLFLRIMLRAGLRPEEATALRVRDWSLPEAGWGEITVSEPTPEVGRQWTDSGEVRDRRRQNKGRTVGDVRYVPAAPDLVAEVRAFVAANDLGPNDLLLTGMRAGDALSSIVVRRAWAAARLEVFGEDSIDADGKPVRAVRVLTAQRVYDLRHTCLTGWLNRGIPPAQVAEWAGNSVPVLLAIYAKCIAGQADLYKQWLEDKPNGPEVAPPAHPREAVIHRPRGARRTSPRISRSHPQKPR